MSLPKPTRDRQRRSKRFSLARHQVASVAAPTVPIRDLARAADGKSSEPRESPGRFDDLGSLLDHFADEPPIFSLGSPMPHERHLPRPRPRAGRCPAAHNRALIGQDIAGAE